MQKLELTQIKKMEQWMYNNARAVDIAKWDVTMNCGDKQMIVNEMLNYQNDDGGFGKGFESDILLPDSSATPSGEAIFTIYEYDLDCNQPMLQKLLAYFEKSVCNIASFWEPFPKIGEDYAHAPWWSYDDGSIFSPNPSAVIASALILYGNKSQKELGMTIAKKALEFLLNNACHDHDLYCIEPLLQALGKLSPTLVTISHREAFEKNVLKNVCKDASRYHEYVMHPLLIVNHPNHLFANSFGNLIEKNFDYYIDSITEEGIWKPNFSWGIDNEVSNQATKNWKGYITAKRIKIFKNFGLLPE